MNSRILPTIPLWPTYTLSMKKLFTTNPSHHPMTRRPPTRYSKPSSINLDGSVPELKDHFDRVDNES